MARVFYIHWNEEEIEPRARFIEECGHEVTTHWDRGVGIQMKGELPDYLVVSLDRLPSHGRAVVEWFWEAKRRQKIPVIFEGGQFEKVDAMKARFPQAVYCGTLRVADAIDWIKGGNASGCMS